MSPTTWAIIYVHRPMQGPGTDIRSSVFMHVGYVGEFGRKWPFLGSKSDHFSGVLSPNRIVRKVSDVGSPRNVALNFLQTPLKHFCNIKLNIRHFFQNIFLEPGLGGLENFGFWTVFGQPVQGF